MANQRISKSSVIALFKNKELVGYFAGIKWHPTEAGKPTVITTTSLDDAVNFHEKKYREVGMMHYCEVSTVLSIIERHTDFDGSEFDYDIMLDHERKQAAKDNNVYFSHGVIVSCRNGGLYLVQKLALKIGPFEFTLRPLDLYSMRALGTGGGWLDISEKNLRTGFFIVGESKTGDYYRFDVKDAYNMAGY